MNAILPASARIAQLARDGLKRQGGQTFENARTVGDQALAAIVSEGGATPEAVYAAAARAASTQRLYHQSAYATQNIALTTLAGGISGPLGPALASLGSQAIHKTVWHDSSEAYADGRHIGARLLDAIRDNGVSGAETALASAARDAIAPHLYNQSAFQVEAEAFARLSSNVQGADVVTTLAAFGRAARMKCVDNENARTVATPILAAIEKTSDTRAVAIAEVARRAAAVKLRPKTASLAQDAGFARILASPGAALESDLAALGTAALNGCEQADDQRNLGHEVLRGITRHATADTAREVARVADEATGQYLYNRSAAAVHFDAFRLIAGISATSEPLHLLAALGRSAIERAASPDDGRLMGQSVLGAIIARETDLIRAAVAQAAQAQAQGAAKSAVATGVQGFAFDWLGKRAVTSAAVQPADAKETDPTRLEERIRANQALATQLSHEIGQHIVQAGAKQTEMWTLANQFNPMAQEDQRLFKLESFARKMYYAGLGTAAAGWLLSGVLLPTGIGVALAIGGAVAAVASNRAIHVLDGKREKARRGFEPLRNRYDQLEAERHVIDAAVSTARALQAQAEDAVRADSGSLEVLKMSKALAERPVKPPGVITNTEDELIIGGVRLQRSRKGPEQGPSPSGS